MQVLQVLANKKHNQAGYSLEKTNHKGGRNSFKVVRWRAAGKKIILHPLKNGIKGVHTALKKFH